MNIAVVHEWILDIGGSEKVLKEVINLFPDYQLFTLFFKREGLNKLGIDQQRVKASFLNKIIGVEKFYRGLLPLFPTAIESMDLSGFNIIFSSSHIAAKGVIPKPYQTHICYCHTPARYLWDMSAEYLKAKGFDKGIKSLLSHTLLNYLRLWDVSTSYRVDFFIANSEFTRSRIKKYYNKDSEVIYPPVETKRFKLKKKQNYFLFLSRLVPYKRGDLVIKAFSKLSEKLVLAGDGPELKRLKKIATRNIEFVGHLSDEEVVKYLSEARALIYPSEEDFGITMVEALASGTPVIAFARGGAAEIVSDICGSDRPTGILFEQQNEESLIEALKKFAKYEDRFDSGVLKASAERFSVEVFRDRLREFINNRV